MPGDSNIEVSIVEEQPINVELVQTGPAGSGGGGSLPSGGTKNQLLTKLSSTAGDAAWRDLYYQLNGTYMNIFCNVTGGDMVDSSFALTLASFLPAAYKMYVFDGVHTSYVVQCGPSPALLDDQPAVGDMFFSHQYFIFTSAVTPNTPLIDGIGRIWYVGGDVGPKGPHDIAVGNSTTMVTNEDHILYNDEFVFVNASADVDISAAIPIAELSQMPVNGHGQFWILRIDNDYSKTVTLNDSDGKTFDGELSVNVLPGDRLHYIHDGSGWYELNQRNNRSLSTLTDVSDTMTPVSGDVLYYDGAEWTAQPEGSGSDIFSEFVYNSTAGASGNRYDDWATLMNKLSNIAGPKRITFERDETLPVGTYNLDYVTFSGDGIDFSLGGYSVTLPDGFNVSSWNNGEVSGGIRVIYTGNDSLITYVGGNRTFAVRNNGAIRSTNASFFDIQGACNFYPILSDTGAIQNGGYEPITVDTTGNVWILANGYVTVLGNNVFRGDISGGSGKVLIASPNSSISPSRTDANLTGTFDVVLGSDPSLIGYNNTISGLAATNVKAAIDELAAGGGGGAVDSVNGQTGVVVLDADDISDSGTTNKFATSAEKTKLGHITVTQAVDLDTMESDIADKQPLDSDLTAIAGLSPTNDDFIQRKSGAWTNRSISQVKSDLSIKSGPMYGDGSDGDVTISADTTITSDMINGIKNYNNLTIDSTKILTCLGGIIFVNGTLTVNGTLSANGGNGSGASGGTASAGPAGTSVSNGGGNGGVNAGGPGLPTASPLSATAIAYGGAGGAGGAAAAAGGVSGLAVTLSTLTEAAQAKLPNIFTMGVILSRNATPIIITGSGRGGGGGAGSGAASGGGGGGGGGCLIIFARHVAGSGTIRANGGNGADASGTGNKGGGGGGGGGFIALFTSDTSHSLTIEVNGGNGGAGIGTGASGSNGSTGRTYIGLGAV